MPRTSQTNDTDTDAAPVPKVLTAIEAAKRISKILDQLPPLDRKRVLSFVTESE